MSMRGPRLPAILASPVLLRELQSGLRERRVMIVHSLYLLALGLFMLMFISSSVISYGSHVSTVRANAGVDTLMFCGIVQFIMVGLVGPSLTCGLLSGEKERKTFEMLLASLLSPAQIVTGKLLSGMSYVLLLLFGSMPLTAMPLLLGGVAVGDFALAYGVLFTMGLLACQIALLFSARASRTTTATLQAYVVVVPLGMVSLMMWVAIMDSRHSNVMDWLFTAFPAFGTHVSPLWWVTMTFVWLSAFLFVRTMLWVQAKAGYVLWLQRITLWWLLASAILMPPWILFYSQGTGNVPPPEGFFVDMTAPAYLFWPCACALLLFLAGFFCRPPVLASQLEQRRYARQISSRWWFFPVAFLGLGAVAAMAFVARGCPLDMLGTTLATLAAMMAGMVSGARAVERVMRGRVPFLGAYMGLYALTVLLPILWLLSNNSRDPGWLSLYYMSPLSATAGIWNPNTITAIDGTPLWQASIIGYVVLAGVSFCLGRRRRP
jgi:ABC-type transport system involved in multi-copper enzyme maturation permease subunit